MNKLERQTPHFIFVNRQRRQMPQYKSPCGPHPNPIVYKRHKRSELDKFAHCRNITQSRADVLNMTDAEVENLYRAEYYKRLKSPWTTYTIWLRIDTPPSGTVDDLIYDLSKCPVECADVEDILNHLGINIEELRAKGDQASVSVYE